ncbi:MAG: AI-2E family transporter [Candidatus Curtissbacteria bacterium]|nr:AI-2E family transporter [Candidatus Curtissbacteria bacterium]
MDKNNTPLRIEISYKTIVFIALFGIGLWLLIQIKSIIILVFLGLILISALLKPVEWLSARKVPRPLAVLIIYISLIAIISFVIGIIIPPLVSQTSQFVSDLPKIISSINDFIVFNKIPVDDVSKVISGQINQVASNAVYISTAIFSSIFFLLMLIVLSFYLLLDWKTFVKLISSPFSGRQETRVVDLISKIERGLGVWVRGQLTLSLLVGVLTYIGLTILGIPFAIPLALVAGIMEIIPIIGPIVSAVPALLVGLTISPVMSLAVIALFFIIQQLENHLIVPMVMSKVVGLQPAAVIIALLIGAKLDGIGGAFLAIPVVLVIKIIIKDFIAEGKIENK